MEKKKRNTCDDYQNFVTDKLTDLFPDLSVRKEWPACERSLGVYAPRVDIAIGPFSITPGETRIFEYDNLVEDHRINAFLRSLYEIHLGNVRNELSQEISPSSFNDLIFKNQNARCFIAFEIENTSTKKHIMGSIVNAASLGRIGIGIAYNDSVLRTFIRILAYLSLLKRVGKNTYDTTNFLIVTKEQFLTILEATDN